MLIEITSPVFKEKGNNRPPIIFKKGLNVILGKEDGCNSIGKTSMLLAIDFVFGGKTYLNSDIINHVNHHTIFFTFNFDGINYYFARNTSEPDIVHICSKGYELTNQEWKLSEFTNWLQEKYHIDFPGLSFREAISCYFRIYGKENYNEKKPLQGNPSESMEISINRLVKLFNRYKDIDVYTKNLEEKKKQLSVYKDARKYQFISNLVGGKKQFEENIDKIRSLQMELDTLTSEQVETHTEEDIAKNKLKSDLKDKKFRLEEQIENQQRKLQLLDISLSYGLYPTEADILGLQEFFPNTNIRKLYDIENYHKKIAVILDDQFAKERDKVQKEIDFLQDELDKTNNQIIELGVIGNLSKDFLDKYSELKNNIEALQKQNEAFLKQKELQDAKKNADEMLKQITEEILSEIEFDVNTKMREYNDTLYAVAHKPPKLHFNSYDSYKFETPDDNGTGSNYKGMIIYDLSIFSLTALPAIAHDSLLLKNISDSSIDGIMRIYDKSEKQVFISFDKQNAFPLETQKILEKNVVLKLSDNNCELYGFSWNEESESEN